MTRQSFTAGSVLTASAMNTLQASVWSDDVNAQTGTSYTLVLTDAGKQITMTNASASTLTIPTNATVAFATGVKIVVINLGAGAVTLTAAGGVTLSANTTNFAIPQYQVATLIKTGTNTWVANTGSGGGADVLQVQVFS